MPSTPLSIPAHWDDCIGVIITLLDADDYEVDDFDDAQAAEWLCLSGAYEGHYFVIDLSCLDLAPVH